MKVTRLSLTMAAAIISSQLLVDVAEAQSSRKAPRINLTTALGSSVASNYVEPSVTLSEDAYVFVISVDADRRVQVLHPGETGISVKMVARRQLHLPRFFTDSDGGDIYSNAGEMRYSAYDYGSGYSDTRGTMIALASRKPFDLSRISMGGDWDLLTLEQLVQRRDPYVAASLLAKYLGAPGEPIGHDVYRFAGGRHYYNAFYGRSAYDDCGFYSGGLGYARGFRTGGSISFFRAAQLQEAGYVVRLRGYDVCGLPYFDVYPHAIVETPPMGRPPAVGAFPGGRLPSSTPRNPTKDGTVAGQVSASRAPTDRFVDREAAPPAGRTPRAGSGRTRPRPETDAGKVSEQWGQWMPGAGGGAAVPAPAASSASGRGNPEHATPRPSPPPRERVSAPRHVPERTYTPPPQQSSPPPPPPRAEPRPERPHPDQGAGKSGG